MHHLSVISTDRLNLFEDTDLLDPVPELNPSSLLKDFQTKDTEGTVEEDHGDVFEVHSDQVNQLRELVQSLSGPLDKLREELPRNISIPNNAHQSEHQKPQMYIRISTYAIIHRA